MYTFEFLKANIVKKRNYRTKRWIKVLWQYKAAQELNWEFGRHMLALDLAIVKHVPWSSGNSEGWD